MIAFSPLDSQRSASDQRPTLAYRIALFAFYIFVISVPAENLVLFSGIGTISRLAGLISLALWGAVTLYERLHIRKFYASAFIFTVLFMIYGFLTTLWAVYPDISIQRTITNIQLLIFLFLMRQFITSEAGYRTTLLAYSFGATLTSLSIFQSYFENAGNYTLYTRLTAENFDPNEAGMNIVIAILILAYLIRTQKSILWRSLGLAVMGVLTISVFLTASRGATIGLAIVYLTFLPYFLRTNLIVRVVLVAGGLLFIQVLTVVVPEASWTRLSDLVNLTQSGLGGRRDIWTEGLIIWQDYPVFGVGVDSFRYKLDEYYGVSLVAHNTFLSILTEQGIIGFTLFTLIVFDLFLSARYLPPLERWFFLSMFIAWSILSFSTVEEYHKITWFVLGLPMVRIGVILDSRMRGTSALLRKHQT